VREPSRGSAKGVLKRCQGALPERLAGAMCPRQTVARLLDGFSAIRGALHYPGGTYGPFKPSRSACSLEIPSGSYGRLKKLSISVIFARPHRTFWLNLSSSTPRFARSPVARRRTQNRTDPRLFMGCRLTLKSSSLTKFGTHGAACHSCRSPVRRRTRTRRVNGNGGCWCSLWCLSTSRPASPNASSALIRIVRTV